MGRRKLETWVIDCETDPFKPGRVPRPFIWGAYNIRSREYQTFGFASLLAEFFRDRHCVVYAHNGGKFDYHYLREYVNSDENILVINGRMAKFSIGKAEFRDSYNILPFPLAEYKKDEIDYGIFEPDLRVLPENAALIEKYLKSDCIYLGELLEQYFARFGRGLTQAGAALQYWAKHYNKGVKPKQTAAQFERYKPYYYGGRVECFRSGYAECAYTIVDKNSAYPHAMLHHHPISTEGMLLEKLPKRELLPQCFVSLTAIAKGCFPYRMETGELIFPRDNEARQYHVTGWELLAAQEMGAVQVLSIDEVHYFRETIDFAGYIHEFYEERKKAKANGDKAGDLFAKWFMNGCYGKFASNPEHYSEYLVATVQSTPKFVRDGYAEYKPWGDGRSLLWRTLPVDRQRYYNIATAASITGFVRAELFKDLCSARGLIYCDTDSISAEDVSRLPIGKELGQWKVELVCDDYAVAGKKMYAKRSAFDQGLDSKTGIYKYPKGAYKVACKGVNLTAAEIIAAAKGGEVEFNPSVPTYSVVRPEPAFVSRKVRLTAKVQHASH